MYYSFKCPVCGSNMPDTICGKCGYTRFLFPKELPTQVEKFEETRVRIMRKCRKKTSTEHANNSVVSSDRTVVGTLMIRNLLTESTYAYPIKEGRNIYGSRQSDNFIRTYINPLHIGIDIPDIIFGIDTSESGLKLIPHKDFEISHNRYLIRDFLNIENDDYFFHSNILGFHAVIF